MCALEMTPAIGTERLILRKPRRTDAAQMAKLADDIGVARALSSMPHPYGQADAEAFLVRAADIDWNADARFAIEHRTEGFIGMLGFDRTKNHAATDPLGPELGYWLGRPYWGRGYATEAARGALQWASTDWRRRVVVAGHFADNPASGEVLVKAGFLYTGEVQPRVSKARGEPVPTRMMVWLA
jgi:RimJ/RimL family protein N-acetyltransferase